MLQWISIALTVTGIILWFTETSQVLGYAIFIPGGVMWLILERAEKKKPEKAQQQPFQRIVQKPSRQPKATRQSDTK